MEAYEPPSDGLGDFVLGYDFDYDYSSMSMCLDVCPGHGCWCSRAKIEGSVNIVGVDVHGLGSCRNSWDCGHHEEGCHLGDDVWGYRTTLSDYDRTDGNNKIRGGSGSDRATWNADDDASLMWERSSWMN